MGYASKDLALADPEHLRTAGWADTLGCRLSILHGYGFGVFHFPLGTVLHAICFHSSPSFGQTRTLRAHTLWPELNDVKYSGHPDGCQHTLEYPLTWTCGM